MTINLADYSSFIVTGRYYNSDRKFRTQYANGLMAFSVNLWNGRVWGIRKSDGKRQLLRTVVN